MKLQQTINRAARTLESRASSDAGVRAGLRPTYQGSTARSHYCLLDKVFPLDFADWDHWNPKAFVEA